MMFDEDPRAGVVLTLDTIVKAVKGKDGERLIEVEASNESVDSEGDVILQKALLDSSKSFVKSGHIDIDHLSELGDRLGIANPMSYIIGRPTEVIDMGKGRTGVRGEIMRAKDGKHDPDKNRFDAFWDSMQADPPVAWRASIYGFPLPGAVEDCRKSTCDSDATRFLVKGMDWRSLAMTRNPVNTDLKGAAKIITAKAYLLEIAKSYPSKGMATPMGLSADMAPAPMNPMPLPWNMDGLVGQYHRHIKSECPHTGGRDTWLGFKDHFIYCCMASPDEAEMKAKALMYHCLLEGKRGR